MKAQIGRSALEQYAVSLLVLFLTYGTFSYAAMSWGSLRGADAPIWPSAGVALGFLMLGGVRLWPAIMMGRLAAALLSGSTEPLWANTLIAAGNTLAAAVPALILARMGTPTESLRSLTGVLRFFFLGGMFSALISASIGSTVLSFAFELSTVATWNVFLNWSFGAFVGVITAGPFILAWAEPGEDFTVGRKAGFIALMAANAAFVFLVFTSSESENLKTWQILPLLIVSGLSYGVRGASTALAVTAAVAVWGTNRGQGPFIQLATNSEQQVLLLLQFLATVALTTLVVAIVTEERRAKDKLAAKQEYMRLAAEQSRARAEELEVILDTVPAVILVAHDPECSEMTTNQFGTKRLRLPQQESNVSGIIPHLRMVDLEGRHVTPDEMPMQRAARGEMVSDFGGSVIFDDGPTLVFFGGARPLYNSDGTVRGAVGAFIDMTERKKAEERITLLAREVDHRAKNIMAIVQAVVRLTKSEDIDSFRKAVTGRVSSLARTHNLLAANKWEGVWIADIIRDELAAFAIAGDGDTAGRSFHKSGPDLQLPPALAQSIALVIHELATNAVKYGALSVPNGSVNLTWRTEEGAQNPTLYIEWAEENGPPVSTPERSGFGSELVKGTLEHQFNGTVHMDWRRSGLVAKIAVPVKD
jgi:two-component sensor histidine kinase/integral membrane sensor domain MASE1